MSRTVDYFCARARPFYPCYVYFVGNSSRGQITSAFNWSAMFPVPCMWFLYLHSSLHCVHCARENRGTICTYVCCWKCAGLAWQTCQSRNWVRYLAFGKLRSHSIHCICTTDVHMLLLWNGCTMHWSHLIFLHCYVRQIVTCNLMTALSLSNAVAKNSLCLVSNGNKKGL